MPVSNWTTWISSRWFLSPADRAAGPGSAGGARGRRPTLATAIAISAITLGVASMIVVLSVMSGFRKAYKDAILGFNAHVVVAGDQEFSEKNEVPDVLKPFVPQISAMSPFFFREGLAIVPDGVSGVILKGVDPHLAESVYPVIYRIPSGDSLKEALTSQGEKIPVIVGKLLYDEMQAAKTEPVTEMTILVPREKEKKALSDFAQKFSVVGTFESGLYEFDAQFCLFSLENMQRLFVRPGFISGYELRLINPDNAPTLAEAFREALPYMFQVLPWNELNEPLFSAMKMEHALFFVVMSMLVLLASFNVAGVMIVTINRRRAEVECLRALGGDVKSLSAIFRKQALFIAACGIAIGSFLAGALLWAVAKTDFFPLDPQIYFVSRLPVDFNPKVWGMLIVLAGAICYGTAAVAARLIVSRARLTQTFR